MFFALLADTNTNNRYTINSNISLKDTIKIFSGTKKKNLEIGKGNRDWFTSQYFVICWSEN